VDSDGGAGELLRHQESAAIPAGQMCSDARRDRRATVGRLGEALAAEHLERLGFVVLARNARTSAGEIDLVALDGRALGRALVFVEVKARVCATRAAARETPLSGLRHSQRLRLRRAAATWLRERGGQRPAAAVLRFDAVGVLLDRRGRLVRLEHIEGAW